MDLKLTKKELDILTVLWSVDKPLTVAEISKHSQDIGISLNQSTVQVVSKKLMVRGILCVAEIKQVNKVLARSFSPAFTQDEYRMLMVQELTGANGKSKTSNLIASLLESQQISDDDLGELAEIIERMRKK